jgi:SPP1 gp7 family putative phage head morphogenesis protein
VAAASIREIRANRARFGIGPRRVREKRLKLGQPPKRAEMEYRRQLVSVSREMSEAIEQALFPLLERLEPQFVKKAADSRIVVTDGFATELASAVAGIRSNRQDQDAIAKEMAQRHISTTNAAQRKRFYQRLEPTAGVNLEGVIEEEGLQDILELSSATNTNLITSIPNDQLAKVESLIFRNTLKGATARSLIEEIRSLADISEARAKLISRDQTSKLNAALNQARQENLGIETYLWRSQRDGLRVRESHRKADAMSRRGRQFRWDTPPAVTGGDHPGAAINCRCTAEAIIPGL